MKATMKVIAIVLVGNLCGCAETSRYGDLRAPVGNQLQGTENIAHENILLYPADWPEISARRERQD